MATVLAMIPCTLSAQKIKVACLGNSITAGAGISNEADKYPSQLQSMLGDGQAPTEYYDLRGVRVSNPSAGLYIRRQGAAVSKVIIR